MVYEKVIADYFNVGLGHIDLVNFELKLYRVKDFGERKFVSLYSSKDLIGIKERLVTEIITSTKSKSVSLPLYGFNHTFKFWLFDVLDTDIFSKSLSERLNEELISILGEMLLSSGLIPTLQKEVTVDKSNDFTILIF